MLDDVQPLQREPQRERQRKRAGGGGGLAGGAGLAWCSLTGSQLYRGKICVKNWEKTGNIYFFFSKYLAAYMNTASLPSSSSTSWFTDGCVVVTTVPS